MENPVKQGQPDHYLFVIDTDTYAGNFERQMCAYVTGQIGECEVGKEQARLAKQEIPEVVAQLEELIKSVPDEHGCHRPVSIFPNPRYGNDGQGNQALLTAENREQFPGPAYNSVAIYFNSIPDSRLLDVMKERAKEIAAREIGLKKYELTIMIEGFRFLEQYTTYTKLNL
ncbi:MAG: hypothetical protein KKA62_01075 [Nanoarchaeota archaeon]|nr:hypothetical protein [Nanoarchaeota archaeon]